MCNFGGEVGVGWEKHSLTLHPPRHALETRKKEDFAKHGLHACPGVDRW